MLVPNTYILLDQAVEEGVMWGWNRAHKYIDNPDEAIIKDAMVRCVLDSIMEYFHIVGDRQCLESGGLTTSESE